MSRNRGSAVLEKYASWLAFVFTFLTMANIPNFLNRFGLLVGPPVLILLAIALLAIPTVRFRIFSFISSGLVVWCYGFIALGSVTLLIINDAIGEANALFARFSFVLSIFVGLALFNSPGKMNSAMAGCALASMVATVFNIWEMFEPGVFGVLNKRPAGLFDNPNVSGTSIVFAMILGTRSLAERWRIPFQFVSGIGVLVTFSRAAILMWVTAMVLIHLLPASRRAARKQIYYWAAVCVLIIGIGVSPLWQQFEVVVFETVTESNIARLLSLQSTEVVADDPRSRLIGEYLQLFWQHPLTGYGLGYADGRLVESQLGPHNMHIAMMIEHGAIGAFVMPTLLIVILHHTTRRSAGLVVPMCAVVLLASFVNHTLLINWGYGAAFALSVAYNRLVNKNLRQ